MPAPCTGSHKGAPSYLFGIEAINFYLVGGTPFKISDKGKRGKNVSRVVEGVAGEFKIVREKVGEEQQVGPRGGGGKAWQKTTLFSFKVSFLL